jgi:aspartate-semialdehyde dehydrogenase
MTLMPNVPEGTPKGELPKIIFAALDSAVAYELEPKFAAAGCAVISNSSAFRMTSDVPLVVPEVNADHLALIETQSWRKDSGGYIVTNPNCCAIGLVMALAPLEAKFGIESLFVSTMQAVSGAGYPGVASLDILGNVVPFIKNEEEKLQEECGKLLGTLAGDHVQMLDAKVSAHCNRVAVEDGHTECVSIKLKRAATYEEIVAAWTDFAPLRGIHEGKALPSAPDQPVEYAEEIDRPQPRLDRMRGNGMAATVGRLRPCNLLDWKFVVLSHNTIRGAAGAAVLNAEILAMLGKLDWKDGAGANPAHPEAAAVLV